MTAKAKRPLSAKKLTLPKGLPALPPVPKGYDAWECLGWGYDSKGKPAGAPWGYFFKPMPNSGWLDASGDFMRAELDIKVSSIAYVIRAIKRPSKPSAAANRKSSWHTRPRTQKEVDAWFTKLALNLYPTKDAMNGEKPARKAGRVLAELRYQKETSGEFKKGDPVFVIRGDADSVERMVEQVNEAIISVMERSAGWETNDLAAAALSAIGIASPGKRGGK